MIAYLLIIATAFCVVAVSLIQLVGDYLFRQQIKDDQRMAHNISDALALDFYLKNASAMYSSACEYVEPGISRVLVLDRHGVVQADTDNLINGTRYINTEADAVLNGESEASNIYAADNSSYGDIGIFEIIAGPSLMTGVYAAAIEANAETIGAVIYMSSAKEIFEGLNTIRMQITLWLVLIAAAAIVLSMFVARTVTRPISELSDGIARMARGDLSSRVKVHGKNEFAQLAMAFNSMSERIEQLDNARSQFVSNASHELKTPLSTIKILIETLMYQDTPDPAMEKEFLNDINKEIDRLNTIVTDLLTLVNVDSGGMKLKQADVRLGLLIQEQAQRLMPLARENGIEMDCVVKDTCETVGDATKLQQVFYNIIDNAIKYTPRGGHVDIEVVKSARRAVIKVKDTGVGIPEADLPHIFERFYRVDKARSRETGGTGLGLSIVKQIVLMHGGTIDAVSKEGEGTAFTVELPILSRKE
ncbi:MAG: HAMP domain-containing protein [Clostridia bacterium]|nr:HAMP domain-containing protein [Clostridia bacterium]